MAYNRSVAWLGLALCHVWRLLWGTHYLKHAVQAAAAKHDCQAAYSDGKLWLEAVPGGTDFFACLPRIHPVPGRKSGNCVFHVSYDNSKHYTEYQAKLEEVKNALVSGKLTDDEKKLAVTEELLLNKKLTTKSVDFHVVCKIMTIGDV